MKRLCPTCNKRRKPELFPPRTKCCELCKIAKTRGVRLERKEKSSKTWIKKLDSLVGSKVRSRSSCEDDRTHICRGSYQWAHGLSRRYHGTRWLLDNGFRLCAGAHKFYTDRPLEWEEFLKHKWGEDKLQTMKRIALSETDFDYKNLYEELCQTLE